MIKIQFVVIFILISLTSVCCKKGHKHKANYHLSHPSSGGVFEQLRRFRVKVNLFQMADKIFHNYKKQKEDGETERKRLEKEEEEKRRRIYEKHLLTYQGGSSFLRDFHTNRF